MSRTAPALAPRTVVEAFLRPDRPVSLASVYDAGNAAGLEDQPLRLAIRRMAAGGELVQEGRGRAGRLVMTDRGRARLELDRLGLALAAGQDDGTIAWDGRWHLVAISAPEDERVVRDGLRRELLAAGGAPVSTGLFASPHDLALLLDPAARAHVVTARADELDVRGLRDPAALAEALWPAAPVVAAYEAIARALADDDPALDPVVRHLRLADALERAIRDDPLVPPELRPRPWRPAVLRTAWRERWRAIAVEADTGVWAHAPGPIRRRGLGGDRPTVE